MSRNIWTPEIFGPPERIVQICRTQSLPSPIALALASSRSHSLDLVGPHASLLCSEGPNISKYLDQAELYFLKYLDRAEPFVGGPFIP